MSFITVGRVALTLLPIISAAVQQVEATAQADKEQGINMTGAQKLQIAVAFVQKIYESTSAPLPFEQLAGVVASFANEFVAMYNVVEAFTHSQPVAKAA